MSDARTKLKTASHPGGVSTYYLTAPPNSNNTTKQGRLILHHQTHSHGPRAAALSRKTSYVPKMHAYRRYKKQLIEKIPRVANNNNDKRASESVSAKPASTTPTSSWPSAPALSFASWLQGTMSRVLCCLYQAGRAVGHTCSAATSSISTTTNPSYRTSTSRRYDRGGGRAGGSVRYGECRRGGWEGRREVSHQCAF